LLLRTVAGDFMLGAAVASGLRAAGLALPAAFLIAAPAVAQFGAPPAPPPSAVPAPAGRNPVCLRLEAQLASVDRGTVDPARAGEIKRYEDAAAKQQADLDRLTQQSQKFGCQGGGFFAIFSGQSPQCGPLNNQIQQVRANIDRYLAEIQRLQGNSGEREGQRRGILTALGQNDCGPQYRQYVNAGPGGFFESLFGAISPVPPSSGDMPLAGTFRTLCVRTCDGYYFPISYSTVPGKFAEDEALCRRLCPATEVMLFSHRNPGEDVSRAVSASGKLYTELPTAFSYRKQFNASCGCRAPGQSWADALRQADDQTTIERGDILVTQERSRQLSQPRVDAQGKPIALDPNPARQTPAAMTPAPGANSAKSNASAPAADTSKDAAPAAEETPEQDLSKRKVRSVGPAFYPAR
jgi:hypothetical protein